MRKAVFTIVARNYIGLAGVLEQSVKENADADYFIFVADEPGDKIVMDELPASVVWSKEKLAIPEELWHQLAFKYSLVEFCTVIKPFCLEYLFEELNYDRVIFFDPDVYVFSSLESIFGSLSEYSMVLTPHITDLSPAVESDHPQYLFLLYGTFNLGFAAIRKDEVGKQITEWWKKVLIDNCFFDNDRGTATDQKWTSLLPGLMPAGSLLINRDKGLNMAPWNFHERKIVKEGDKLYVTDRNDAKPAPRTPLVFAHFSGYDYTSLGQKKVVHKNEELNRFEDLDPVLTAYAAALADSWFARYSNAGYAYNTFPNGKNILSLHRRLYRRMLEEKKEYGNPFATGADSFYELLRKRKLIDHSPAQADKVTGKNIAGFDRKLGKVNFAAGILKRMLGVRRYSIMIRFLRRYFKEENQAFLLDKEAGKKLWK